MESNCTFEFAAPQFLESLAEAANFADQDGADSYFDTLLTTPLKSSQVLTENENSDKFYTPSNILSKESDEMLNIETELNKINETDDNKENKKINEQSVKKSRKRSHGPANHKTPISRNESLIFDGIEVPVDNGKEKEHTMVTRQDKIQNTPTLELRARQVVRLAGKKRKCSPKPNQDCFKKKHVSTFMSLAEKVMHFQLDTPPRFKTKIAVEEKENRNVMLKPTVPHSPNLITKSRIRTNDNIVNSDETETYKFKATKLNHQIFKKPDICDRPKPKSPTVPTPFNLTEVIKKEPVKEEVFHFKARPMPKSFSGSCDTLNSSMSSTCSYRRRRRNIKNDPMTEEYQFFDGMSTVNNFNLSTQLKPFSFDERDKEMLQKKLDKIKQIQEEEKKIPVFHAAPVPGFISSSAHHGSTSSLISENGSLKKSLRVPNSEDQVISDTTFKAKFPTVLHKEPFVPQKSERTRIEPTCVELNTEKRARERQQFEKELKLKEEKLKQERMQVVAFLEKHKKEEIIELRKKLVHKPLPVPDYPVVNLDLKKKS